MTRTVDHVADLNDLNETRPEWTLVFDDKSELVIASVDDPITPLAAMRIALDNDQLLNVEEDATVTRIEVAIREFPAEWHQSMMGPVS